MQRGSERPNVEVAAAGAGIGKKIAILAVFAACILLFFAFDLDRLFNLQTLKENREALLQYTSDHYVLSVFIFVLIYFVQTALSLPGAAIMTLAGGFLFGAVLGTVYVNAGATTGATIAFLAARYLFRDAVESRFGRRLEAIERGFSENAFSYLLTLRFIPIFPFFLVNLAAGLTRISLGTYVVATAVGIIPASFVYANAGRQLGAIETTGDLASPGVLGAFVLLGLLALVPIAYQRFRRTQKRTDHIPL